MFNIKILDKRKVGHTYGCTIVNFKTQECYDLYFQVSLKDPWLIPRYRREFGKAKMPLYGWLFFYCGRMTRGIVYPINKSEISSPNKLLVDKNNRTFALCTVSERKLADQIRETVKTGRFCFDVKKEEEDTIIEATLKDKRNHK